MGSQAMPSPLQQEGDRADRGIEQEGPQDAGDHRRDRIGQQDDAAIEAAAAHHAVGGEGQHQGDGQGDGVLGQGEPDGDPDRRLVLGAGEQRPEIVEPDELDAVAERIGEDEGLGQRADRRDEEEQQQHQELRQQQEQRQARLAIVRALEAGVPSGRARLSDMDVPHRLPDRAHPARSWA